MVIGLDVSTAVVGITALADSGELLGISHITLGKIPSEDVGRKGDAVRDVLKSKFLPLAKDGGEEVRIYIEEAAKRFPPRMSNAHTIFTLARFNGIVTYIAYDMFGVLPVDVNVSHARKKTGVILRKVAKGTKSHIKKKMTKEDVINFVLEIHKPKEVGFKKTCYDNWYDWCGDRADSYVIARYGVMYPSSGAK